MYSPRYARNCSPATARWRESCQRPWSPKPAAGAGGTSRLALALAGNGWCDLVLVARERLAREEVYVPDHDDIEPLEISADAATAAKSAQ